MSTPRAELSKNLLDNSESEAELKVTTTRRSRYTPPATINNSTTNILSIFQPQASTSMSIFSERRKTRVSTPITPPLSDEYKPAANLITSLLTLCTSHRAWAIVAPFSKHGKPDGVFALQTQLHAAVRKENAMSDVGIKKTLEDISVAASGHHDRFSFTRHRLTDEFYSILSSFKPIDNFDHLDRNDLKKIEALNTKVNAFIRKLDNLVKEHDEPMTSFPWRCCF